MRDSTHFADLTVQRIIERVERAALSPTAGHSVHEYPERPLREVHEGNHRIIYRFTQRSFEVITIVHFRQRLPGDRLS